MAAPRPESRLNEYFIDKQGISREVIQADICRYLGRDALVRPGTYEGRTGYFIKAYRNLTSGMIDDLRNDSARWEQDRQYRESRGQGTDYPAGAYREQHPQRSDPGYPPSGQPYPPEQSGYVPPQTTQPGYVGSYPYGTQPSEYPSVPATTVPPGYAPQPVPVTSSESQYGYVGSGDGYAYPDSSYAPRTSGGMRPEYQPAGGAPSGPGYAPAASPDHHRPSPVDQGYNPGAPGYRGQPRPPPPADPHRRAH